MTEARRLLVDIGTTCRTSARAPIDGDYGFVEHVKPSDCTPSPAERQIYLYRGDLLPFCKRCGKRAMWKLTDTRFEITPEMDKSEWVLKTVRGDRPDVPYPAGSKR